MPAQGSRPDLAIERAQQLLAQAGVSSGHILLITDAVAGQRDVQAAANAHAAGHRVSVLAVGTVAGTPLRGEDGQFLQHSNGAIVVSQLDIVSLQRLAAAGGGTTVSLTTSEEDLDTLDGMRRGVAIMAQSDEAVGQKVYWIEYSPWFLWVLVVVLLFAFRRGVIA
jgi:Ca-activated chloride channel family protein